MKRIYLLAILIISVFISGCGNKDLLIEKQQQQIDELTKRMETISTSTSKTENKVAESQKIIERIIERPVAIETKSDNSELLNQINSLQSQLNNINSETTKQQPISNAKVIASFLPKTVKLWCATKGVEGMVSGSGSIISSNGRVFTNYHVAGFIGNICIVGITSSPDQKPTAKYFAKVVDGKSDLDIASLQIDAGFNETTNAVMELGNIYLKFIQKTDYCDKNKISIGDKLTIIGYPAIGGSTITATDGIISGFEGLYIKTSAKIEHGNSGGLAVHETGCVLGIPTASVAGELESLGMVIDLTSNSEDVQTTPPVSGGSITIPSTGGSTSIAVDSDNDGLTDYDETNKWHSDPNKWDTDGDGFSDGAEVNTGFNPNGPGKL